MPVLMVAAGGGGDAIAAAVLAHAIPGVEAVGIATLAWDRLIVDPLPGPRVSADFTGLETRNDYQLVTPTTQPVPPAGSTLPRLAGDLPLPLILLDPAHGAAGLRRQFTAAVNGLGADSLGLVDVGGDILGQPGDAGLRSPLADALMAAGCVGLPTTVWVVGAGLDGELAESLVLHRIDARPVAALGVEHWPAYLPILGWHPSEATALLAAASLGLRGRVEVRDAGLPVQLTDHSANVYELPLATIVNANGLAAALADSTTFAEAEQIARGLLGWTELDHERAKAAAVTQSPPEPADLDVALPTWEAEARARGVEFVTFRRLAEVMGWRDVEALRWTLAARRAVRESSPIWAI